MSVLLFATLLVLVGACGGSSDDDSGLARGSETTAALAAGADAPATTETSTRQITIDVSIYIVDGESPELRSSRTVEEVRAILERVNEIWASTGITFDVAHVARITAPDEPLAAVVAGGINEFLAALGNEVALEQPSTLNIFYVRAIGGPNGIAPTGTRVALVIDRPSVDDERVTAHELGHHLGLHHVLTDEGRLLFPGTNGRTLTEEEAQVAAYVARGLLNGVR
ncbi:MAG: hypothetical protein ACR2OD_10830 [Gaiellaceae bacterium]